jgi:cytidylate kinase
MRVVAIDGPAGTGKSTVARGVAERLGLDHLDTGAMYRAVTWAVLQVGADPADPGPALALTRAARLEIVDERVLFDGLDVSVAIRGAPVTQAVSAVSAHAEVRAELVARQRAWAAERGGGVVEGRDIGTVVFPDAELKVFLTASPAVRAARRAGESGSGLDAVAADLERRDLADSSRAESPLAAAPDALVLDTSDISAQQAIDRIVALLDQRTGPGSAPSGHRGGRVGRRGDRQGGAS